MGPPTGAPYWHGRPEKETHQQAKTEIQVLPFFSIHIAASCVCPTHTFSLPAGVPTPDHGEGKELQIFQKLQGEGPAQAERPGKREAQEEERGQRGVGKSEWREQGEGS